MVRDKDIQEFLDKIKSSENHTHTKGPGPVGVKKLLSMVYQVLDIYDSINYIDVGIARGLVLTHLQELGLRLENVNSIGIDPLLEEYLKLENCLSNYTALLPNAISLKDDEECDFYVQQSLNCSSLNKINKSYITNTKDGGDNFYLPSDRNSVLNTIKTIKVSTKKLSTIIEEQRLDNEIIHFLKIDAQGQDLNVIKSCGKYLKNVLLIMVETTMPDIENGTLYENSTNFKQDNEFLEKNGFKLLGFEKLLEDDADALYFNESLVSDIPLQ